MVSVCEEQLVSLQERSLYSFKYETSQLVSQYRICLPVAHPETYSCLSRKLGQGDT